MVGGRGRRRVIGEPSDHLVGTVQMLLDRGGPMNVGMEQPLQARPIATLDRVEDIAHRWDLLRHPKRLEREAALGPTESRHVRQRTGAKYDTTYPIRAGRLHQTYIRDIAFRDVTYVVRPKALCRVWPQCILGLLRPPCIGDSFSPAGALQSTPSRMNRLLHTHQRVRLKPGDCYAIASSTQTLTTTPTPCIPRRLTLVGQRAICTRRTGPDGKPP
jgi:hypothetical protein